MYTNMDNLIPKNSTLTEREIAIFKLINDLPVNERKEVLIEIMK
jgi:hypothetical protein